MKLDEFVKGKISAWLLITIHSLFLVLFFKPSVLGIVLFIIGGIIYCSNRALMGSAWSINVKEKKVLVKKGLFKYLRHPLYLGALIISFSTILLVSIPTIVFLFALFITLPYLYYRAILEERLLSKTLKGYKKYMKSTGRFLPKPK